MQTFIMLTRLGPGAVPEPGRLEQLEHDVAQHVRSACPNVEWKASWAVMGPYDYVDVFEAPDIDTALKTAAVVRSFGRAQTEVLPATDWRHFKELLHEIDGGKKRREARQ